MTGPSVGEPGYLPYCGGCPTMMRMVRDEARNAFVCKSCGLETRRVNGEDMFDRTALVIGAQAVSSATLVDLLDDPAIAAAVNAHGGGRAT